MPEAPLPTGTITFLFTDIEGSTRLLHELGRGYDEVQDAHHAILRRAIAAGDGTAVRTEGDSFFAVFPSAPGAIETAVAAQQALAEHQWGHGKPLRVRMGMHTGEGRLREDDYIGMDVHRAARIAAAGHGGQVLISDPTLSLASGDLPARVGVRTLGVYQLKDLPSPERLHQLEIQGLPSAFPALRALDVRRAHLPPQVTNFIGRQTWMRSRSCSHSAGSSR